MRLLISAVAALCAAAALSVPAAMAAPSPSAPPGGSAPPMGWNSWNNFGCDINEQLIRDTADGLIASGMKEAGYNYVNLDDCWAEPERNAEGKLEANHARFPSGIKALGDYLHTRGLKLGIYTSAGTQTCALTMPGALDHEDVDAQTFADWGVDYLKYDNCNNEGRPAQERYAKMGEALRKTGRPIVYAVCEWGDNDPWTWAPDVGATLWRTTGDISDSWTSMTSILDKQVGLEAYSGPGAWNDPDMLEVGNGGMTDTEYRAHFALWALLNAPLLAGNDLRSISPETKQILLNKELIAVDQDWGGKQGHKIRDDGNTEVWAKPMSDGSTTVVLFNRGDGLTTMSTSAAEIGLGSARDYRVRDLWTSTETESAGTLHAAVPSHGSAVFRVWPARFPTAAPHGSLSVLTPEVIGADKPFTTTVQLFNDGSTPLTVPQVSVKVPAGWQVDGRPDAYAAVVLPGKSWQHTWTLKPVAPNGDRVTVTAQAKYWTFTGQRTISTDGGAPLGTPPPAGTTGMSTLPWILTENGHGPAERDMSNGEGAAGDGHALTVAGTSYPTGFGVHSPSRLRFYLGGRCTSLTSLVGIDDEAQSPASVNFIAVGDGKQLAISDVMRLGQPVQRLDAQLTGVQVLDLVVSVGPDTNDWDHSDWVAPTITC